MSRRNRRQFVAETAGLTAAGLTVRVAAAQSVSSASAAAESASFASRWHLAHDRVWIGPEYWANPLQDWRVASGRLQCIKDAPERHVHLLTHPLVDDRGTLEMRVRVGRLEGKIAGPGSVGFRIGIRGELNDFRHALLFGDGVSAGLTGGGKLFLDNPAASDAVALDTNLAEVELHLIIVPNGASDRVTLKAVDVDSGDTLAAVTRRMPPQNLRGQLALVANFGGWRGPRRQPQAMPGVGNGQFWFADWQARGSRLGFFPDRAFGPILFSQYTLSAGTLKMSAQMPPLGARDTRQVRLEVLNDKGVWRQIASADIEADACLGMFHVKQFAPRKDVDYRICYALAEKDGPPVEHYWTGRIRRDPADADVLAVADISCNGHMAFPNADYVWAMASLDPDLLAFTGDQFYEPSGGYGVQRQPLDMAILDQLRKWYLHGWTWRELMRDRPSISIPDDHDVYQGNIWGEGGRPRRGTQEMGGYDMPPRWVNVVHRTQTAHHPDPFDAAAGVRGITSYFGALVYGGVSFAILADRQFKSGPEGKVPPTGDRGDHVVDPAFDPRSADLPGLELLGERQMEFLREWASDWRDAQMKAVISQTIFTAMATTHGAQREVLRADYDANGWPQAARNAALREIRKAFAFHIAGDQHLPAVIRYGIDAHGDAGAALAGPAVNSIYPRWFEPQGAAVVEASAGHPHNGRFIDHFGHPLEVLAVANPDKTFSGSLLETERAKACGLALVRFDKPRRAVTIECWPLPLDSEQLGKQFAGWPVTIEPVADRARHAQGWLPKLKFSATRPPVIQVFDESGELVYNLRATGGEFQPFVFAPGTYSIRALDPESNRERALKNLVATPQREPAREIRL